MQEITSLWNPELAQRNVKERFGLGASLWLIKFEDQLAGYGWTLQGRTVEPHYFRLGPDDVHLFDFHVFRQYRGRGLNPLLVTHILAQPMQASVMGARSSKRQNGTRRQLASLRRTPFRLLGSARKFTVLGHTIVLWAGNETVQHGQRAKTIPIPPLAGKRPT